MIVEKLSKFIVDLDYEDIPKIAIDKAKLCFLDFLGVSNRGFHEKNVQIAIKTINELYGYNNGEKSSIIGEGYSSIASAGFINGISAHALDLDDGHRFAQLHPGCVVFPTALAIAEANNVGGKEFIEAVICGYEVAIVIGTLANPYHRNQGFHSTGTIGVFGATATASKLLQLDLGRTINALGLCGTLGSGLLEVDHQGTMGKQIHAGKAAYNGILSGYLAKNGFTGAESIIDGDEGFLKAMSIDLFKDLNENGLNFKEYLSSYLDESIGKFHIKEVYLKKYPFCRHLHSSIDATLNISSQFCFEKDNVNDIEKIVIKTYKIAAEHNNFNPKNKEEIKQSLPYAVAVAIVENRLDLDLIENNIINININNINNDLNNYLIKNILDKIVIEEDEEFTKLNPLYRPSKVIIETNNGIYEDLVKLPLGEAENPLSKEDILEKFKNINPNFDSKKLHSIDNCIDNIEDYDISDFMKIRI